MAYLTSMCCNLLLAKTLFLSRDKRMFLAAAYGGVSSLTKLKNSNNFKKQSAFLIKKNPALLKYKTIVTYCKLETKT